MRKIVLLFTILCASPGLFAQKSKLDEAWKKFQNNERSAARELFTEAASNTESAEEAHLALSILYAEEGYSIEAMKSFQEFMKISANPYPYMDVLWSSSSITGGNGKKSKERLNFLKSLQKDKNLPGYLAAKLHANLGYHFQALGEFEDAKEQFDQIGSITTWSSVGSFENISASGFDKEWAALKNPSESYAFKDKNNATVRWFPITEVRNDRWIDHEYYFYSGNSIIFSQTFVSSPTTQKVQLRVGVSGSVKVWLNDNLVMSEIEERNNGFDSYIIETTLKEGTNRVLIQIGESEADNSNFLLRITDENGTNIQGLTFDNTSQAYDKGPVEAKVLTHPAVDYFEKQVNSNASFLNLILLSKAYSNIDMRLQARKTLVKAETLAPNCTYVQLKLINVYSSEGNRTAIAKVIEWLKDHDKNNPISISIIYDEAVENENYAKADSLLEVLEKLQGEDAEGILEKKINLYASREKNEELISTIEKGYDLYPENYTFVLLKAAVERERKNKPGALKVVKKYTKSNYSVTSQKELASLYFQNGMVNEGLELYKEMIENEPIGVGLYQNLSDFYFQLQQYDKAIELLDKAVEIAPYTTYNLNQRAKCYAEKGDDDNAKADYQRALELSSTNFSARHKLREMAGMKKDIFENFEKVDVYKLFKEAGSATDYPEDNSVILLNSVQKVVYQDGASEEKHTLVAKVFNAAGIDNWKEYSVGYYGNQRVNIEKVEVLKAN
ncbi:MAG TPA: tetratricopeptide repeat protein, partial [Bacteroidia bacterium]|nr:tetratricopeptide repeat protein [Bacteroidia bacterium]